MNTNKLAINWQNIARVRLQLKFAFILRTVILCLIVLLKQNNKLLIKTPTNGRLVNYTQAFY